MSILNNPKHEHFAHLIAKGLTPAKAYTSVGYSKGGAAQSGARLLRDAHIRARVAQLTEAVAERAIEKCALDRAWVLAGLKDIHGRAIQAVPVLDRDGAETGLFKYDAASAIKTLELIGKELGMFKEQVKVENTHIWERLISGRERLARERGEAPAA